MSDETTEAPGHGPLTPEQEAAEHLQVSTEAAKRMVALCIKDGLTPSETMLGAMLTAAFMAKALDLDRGIFLEGCRSAFVSVEVSNHGLQ